MISEMSVSGVSINTQMKWPEPHCTRLSLLFFAANVFRQVLLACVRIVVRTHYCGSGNSEIGRDRRGNKIRYLHCMCIQLDFCLECSLAIWFSKGGQRLTSMHVMCSIVWSVQEQAEEYKCGRKRVSFCTLCAANKHLEFAAHYVEFN